MALILTEPLGDPGHHACVSLIYPNWDENILYQSEPLQLCVAEKNSNGLKQKPKTKNKTNKKEL